MGISEGVKEWEKSIVAVKKSPICFDALRGEGAARCPLLRLPRGLGMFEGGWGGPAPRWPRVSVRPSVRVIGRLPASPFLGVLEAKGLFWQVGCGAGLEENLCDVSRAHCWGGEEGGPDPERTQSSRDHCSTFSGTRAKPVSPVPPSPVGSHRLGKGVCIPPYEKTPHPPVRGGGRALSFQWSFTSIGKNERSRWLVLLPASEKHYLAYRI